MVRYSWGQDFRLPLASRCRVEKVSEFKGTVLPWYMTVSSTSLQFCWSVHTPSKTSVVWGLQLKKETVVHFFPLHFYIFYNCIVPMGFLPWDIRVAFSGESQL